MDRQNEQFLTINARCGNDTQGKQLLTVGEVAGLLGVSGRTVYNLIYGGTLRACRLAYHVTVITREDFLLMLRENTYRKRCVPLFAKQRKKDKQKEKQKDKEMKTDIQKKTGKDTRKTSVVSFPEQEGKGKQPASQKGRRLIPAGNYKQSVRDTFTDKGCVDGELYTMAEICRKFNYTYGRFYNLRMRYSIPCVKANATKCFPKAEVDRAMAEEAERLGKNLSEHWYTCFDIMRLFGLGKTQVRRFALAHGVRAKRANGNRLFYLKADWDAARKTAELKSACTKAKREE